MDTVLQSSRDLFGPEWHEYEVGRQLRCRSAKTLVAYACSASAMKAKTSGETSQGVPRATIEIIGPTCWDGNHLEVSYRLTRSEFKTLPEEDKEAFRKALKALMAPTKPSWRLLAIVGVPK